MHPNLQLVASDNDDQESEPETDFDYDGFDQDCESDMMALCFLHEAMAMSRRSVEKYARSYDDEDDEDDETSTVADSDNVAD